MSEPRDQGLTSDTPPGGADPGGRETEQVEAAIALNNLDIRYKEQGRLAEAEPLYQRALAIRERVLGPEHLEQVYGPEHPNTIACRESCERLRSPHQSPAPRGWWQRLKWRG